AVAGGGGASLTLLDTKQAGAAYSRAARAAWSGSVRTWRAQVMSANVSRGRRTRTPHAGPPLVMTVSGQPLMPGSRSFVPFCNGCELATSGERPHLSRAVPLR